MEQFVNLHAEWKEKEWSEMRRSGMERGAALYMAAEWAAKLSGDRGCTGGAARRAVARRGQSGTSISSWGLPR